jgi:hypothetical protein
MKSIILFICIGLIFTSILVRENSADGLIGGGDHDNTAFKLNRMRNHLAEKSLDELKKEAFKLEIYINSKSKNPILGGLHDYIDTISKEELIEVMSGMILNNIELLELNLYESVVDPLEVEEKKEDEPAFVGGLVDYIWRQTDDVLRQWALTCDKFDKEKRNIKLLGGLDDYVNTLTREQLMEIILKHAKTYPQLNSGVVLNRLSISYGFAQPEQNKEEEQPELIGGFSDYLWNQSEDVLRHWALSCERYQKEKKNLNLIGGLVNYVRLLKKDKLINIILNYTNEFPELKSAEKLNSLAVSYGIAPPQEEATQKVGGLVDYIWRIPEETLRQWALTCEKYDRTSRKVELRGGLHDYVDRLSKEELIKIILDYTNTYPEISSGLKLTQLSISYGFTPYEETQQPPEPVATDGGLHDYIWRVRDDVLVSWALTCDKYDREVRKVRLLGGLVDYVRLLKKDELVKIVMDFTQKYPELNSAAKLQELANSYGIAAPDY